VVGALESLDEGAYMKDTDFDELGKRARRYGLYLLDKSTSITIDSYSIGYRSSSNPLRIIVICRYGSLDEVNAFLDGIEYAYDKLRPDTSF